MVFKAMVVEAKFWTQIESTIKKTIVKKTIVKKTMVAMLLFIGFAGGSGVRTTHGLSTLALQPFAAQESSQESSQENWRTEFDNICAKTEDAMTFSQEELTDLIRRCDNLQPRIEKLDESRRKVYLERLRKCRGLYAYVLDAKKKEKK